MSLLVPAIVLSTIACGPSNDPQIVAIAYVRAAGSGDSDIAVSLLDIERIASRVEEQIMVLESTGRESFLEDSIETLLWGFFQETPTVPFAYDATPAQVTGDTAHVDVSKTSADGASETVVVHLRDTDRGWRVSGASLDRLVTVVVQRLQEKY